MAEEIKFEHRYRGNLDDRKGQSCRLISRLGDSKYMCMIEFEDKHRIVCPRASVIQRRKKTEAAHA